MGFYNSIRSWIDLNQSIWSQWIERMIMYELMNENILSSTFFVQTIIIIIIAYCLTWSNEEKKKVNVSHPNSSQKIYSSISFHLSFIFIFQFNQSIDLHPWSSFLLLYKNKHFFQRFNSSCRQSVLYVTTNYYWTHYRLTELWTVVVYFNLWIVQNVTQKKQEQIDWRQYKWCYLHICKKTRSF